MAISFVDISMPPCICLSSLHVVFCLTSCVVGFWEFAQCTEVTVIVCGYVVSPRIICLLLILTLNTSIINIVFTMDTFTNPISTPIPGHANRSISSRTGWYSGDVGVCLWAVHGATELRVFTVVRRLEWRWGVVSYG